MALQKGMTWFRRQGAPVTVCIIASMIVFAFVWWFAAAKGMDKFMLGPNWQSQPWTLVTYPWADTPFYDGLRILFFVFMAMWMFYTGSSVERELGGGKYLALWFAMILLPALFIIGLGPLVNRIGAAGMWLPEAGITIVWCVRNPKAQIMMYGLIPLSGKILGFVTAGVTVLLSGYGSPVFGAIASLHLIVAWAFAANYIPFFAYTRGASPSFGKAKMNDNAYLKKSERMDKSYYDDVNRRAKEREEREKLKKLFESSINDDADKDR